MINPDKFVKSWAKKLKSLRFGFFFSRRFRYSLILLLVFAFFILTPWGKVFVKTTLLLPSIWPNAPVRPLQILSKPPIVEDVEIPSGSEKIKVYIYRPNDSKRHPTIILMNTGMVPTADTIVHYAQGFSRVGFVVAIPEFPELFEVDKVSLRTEQTDHLVNIFQAMSQKEFINPQKIGFMGACAGGSLALVAAEDSKISSQVGFVIAVSPYFDALTTYRQIYLKTIYEDEKAYPWQPQSGTALTTSRLLVNTLPKEEDRAILTGFIEGKGVEGLDQLSFEAKKIYEFMNNSNPESFLQLWNNFPQETKKVLARLSPSTKIKDLKAHIFVLSDDKDTFIPHTESLALAKSLPSSQSDYIELDLLEHAQLARRLPRLKTMIEVVKVAFFGFKALALIS